MTDLLQRIADLQAEARTALSRVQTLAELEQFRNVYLARRGKIPTLLRTVKDLPSDERRPVGAAANTLRRGLEAEYLAARARLRARGVRPFDVTVPGRKPVLGHLHPLTIVRRDIEEVFLGMGFEILDGPEVEEPRYNFDLLNVPLEHPARDLMDTFWLTDGRLLRTHTSAAQARVMANRTPPFRILIPGRVFRHEATDATHESTFSQFEGLYVDEGVSLADLKGVLGEALQRIVHQRVDIRFRPSYFPFVEPGVEVDISCLSRRGSHRDCRVCKGTGWVEILGAGMIHPVVLQNVAVDSTRYRGFAFGGSIDRLAMLRYRLTDIRLFWSGDPNFLEQF
ncbi:MAG: phenylalanyl-tRNA synthetase alpha chain [Parcubacteria group bacterium Gr01-1014_38]|nr:MAG: phenylalanyl-tRNA synthetase alpha chain [Parcubacteria group bacterium Gr01-1014_38]